MTNPSRMGGSSERATATGGNAHVVLGELALSDKANLESNAATVGRIAGYAVSVANPEVFLTSTTYGGALDLTKDAIVCAAFDRDAGCAGHTLFEAAALSIPGGVGRIIEPYSSEVASAAGLLGGMAFTLGEGCYNLWKEKLGSE